jgi:hypothetical protein
MENSDRSSKIRERAHSLWQNAGSPEGGQDEHWFRAEREIDQGEAAIEGDDQPNLAAMREAARQRSDTYWVKSDLEDADQREAAPGTREQP